jgi:hypothetical protein
MRELFFIGIFLLCGVKFAAWGFWRLRQPPRKDDWEWAQRHPMLNRLLGDSSWRRTPMAFERAGAQACIAAGCFALILGTALLVGYVTDASVLASGR